MGSWGIYDYYNIYSQEGWWTMFWDWIWISSGVGTILELPLMLILVATGDLTFGDSSVSNMTEFELLEAEAKAEAEKIAKENLENEREGLGEVSETVSSGA